MAVRNAFLPLTSNFALHAVWVAVAVAGVLVLSGLVWSCLRGKKEKNQPQKKSFFTSWFSHCNIIGRNDTSLLVLKWKPRVITSFGFWKKIYRSFPFVELNPGPIRGLDVVFVPQKRETEILRGTEISERVIIRECQIEAGNEQYIVLMQSQGPISQVETRSNRRHNFQSDSLISVHAFIHSLFIPLVPAKKPTTLAPAPGR